MSPASTGAQRPRLLALALLVTACGDSVAPAPTYDPTADLDAESNPAAVDEEAGTAMLDAGSTPTPRPDAGRKDGGTQPPGDAALGDAQLSSDARAVEQAAFEAIERLLVADGRAARAHVLDVLNRSHLGSFTLVAPGRVQAGASGRYGYVLEAADNQVQIVSSGLTDPGQASTPMLVPPSLLNVSLRGVSPSALASRADQVAILFAGAAELASFSEATLETTRPEHTLALGAAASTGVLLHLGDRLLVSESPAGNGASTLRVVDTKLVALSAPQLSCTAPEAAALAGDLVAVACADGVLLWKTSASSGTTLPYPSAAGGARAHKLVPSPLVPAFLTQLGERMCIASSDAFNCVDAPSAGTLDYAFDPSGKRALVLARDGTLHVLEGETLAARDTVEIFAPLAADTPADELPGLAVGRRFAYVSDPALALIQLVDVAGARLIGEIGVPGGFPTQIAVLKYPL